MLMRLWKTALAAAAAATLCACASLSSETPLFTPADQVGPPPLTEGVWIMLNDDCSARNARRKGRLPRKCFPLELRRQADGAWSFRFQDHVKLDEDRDAESPPTPRAYRLIIVPATQRQPADSYVPLYVAEYAPAEGEDDGSRSYALIVPEGTLPARDFRLMTQLSCSQVALDGPVEGVTVTRNESGDIVSCRVSTQAGVREAARRAFIEGAAGMFDGEDGRLLFVRP